MEYINSHPKVMLGKPVVKGTRITVESILEKLSEQDTVADILEAHPHIFKEAIFAALNLKADTIYPIFA